MATVSPLCLKCGEVQKCFLSIEEATVILKMALESESFPKRVRLGEKGEVLEEFIDVLNLVRMWRALKGLKI